MGLTKVFVGNLSFKTRDSDLASEFSSAGKVVSANIITRGPRSLGYGFVELETEEEAQKAVTLMNKKNIDTREINVELARPRDEAKLAEKRNSSGEGEGGRGGRGRGRGGPGLRGDGRGRGRGRGYGNFARGARRYRPRGQSDDSLGGEGAPVGTEGGDPNYNNNQTPGGAPYIPRGRGRGRGRGLRGGRGGRGGRGRGGYNNRPQVQRELSKSTLYVANLPYSVRDEALADLFKDLKATKCYVVKAPTGRSKGFGFVEFANEEDQKAALPIAEKFVVEERNLIVKIALTENRANNDDNNNENNNNDGNNEGQNASELPPTQNPPNVQQKSDEKPTQPPTEK